MNYNEYNLLEDLFPSSENSKINHDLLAKPVASAKRIISTRTISQNLDDYKNQVCTIKFVDGSIATVLIMSIKKEVVFVRLIGFSGSKKIKTGKGSRYFVKEDYACVVDISKRINRYAT